MGLGYLVMQAEPKYDTTAIAGLYVYGISLCLAFLTSALYHGVQHARIKPILQRIDHCTVFLLIAGTYTPIAMVPLRHHGGVALLALIWIFAIAGIAVRLANAPLYRRIAIPLYLAMGWMGCAWGAPLHRAIGDAPILLMWAGAMTYTGGLLLYHWHRLPFSNCLWHLSVVAGSAWFFVAIDRMLST